MISSSPASASLEMLFTGLKQSVSSLKQKVVSDRLKLRIEFKPSLTGSLGIKALPDNQNTLSVETFPAPKEIS